MIEMDFPSPLSACKSRTLGWDRACEEAPKTVWNHAVLCQFTQKKKSRKNGSFQLDILQLEVEQSLAEIKLCTVDANLLILHFSEVDSLHVSLYLYKTTGYGVYKICAIQQNSREAFVPTDPSTELSTVSVDDCHAVFSGLSFIAHVGSGGGIRCCLHH